LPRARIIHRGRGQHNVRGGPVRVPRLVSVERHPVRTDPPLRDPALRRQLIKELENTGGAGLRRDPNLTVPGVTVRVQRVSERARQPWKTTPVLCLTNKVEKDLTNSHAR